MCVVSARFFVPSVRPADGVVVLPPEEAHHLTHVLRLGVGDEVSVFDGAGREWRGRVEAASKRAVTIAIGEAVQPVAEPPVHVTLGIALVKGDQMDAVIRDATALGAAVIAPLTSAHVTVSSRAWRTGAALDRWRRVAIAAAKQSRRATVPAISPVSTFESTVEGTGEAALILCVEPAHATATTQPAKSRPASAIVLVGPEGGWSAAEVELAKQRGAELLSLGPRTLRAEIAPVVALSALWTRWGW